MYRADDEIRRTDLNLRCLYPELETEIYKIDPFQYVICCTGYTGDFNELSEIFRQSVRMIASPVSLVQTAPEEFLEKLAPIPLGDPVAGFRASAVTEPEVMALAEAKYPDTEIVEIRHHPGADYTVDIFVGPETPTERMMEMKTFLGTVLGTDTVRVERQEPDQKGIDRKSEEGQTAKNPMLQFMDNSRLGYHKELSCSAAEADYWFSNAEAIYQNRISRPELPFFRDRQKNCFIDCSVNSPIDIRNALFLYETVYLGVPMKKYLDAFLAGQRMTRKELLELVDMGKAVLVQTGAEEGYDEKLLNEAYGLTPFGVVGRRGVNILIASYLSELEKRYSDHFTEAYGLSKELYRRARKDSDQTVLLAADLMSYPLRAKAQSFVYLNNDGLLSLTGFGVNTLVQDMLSWQLEERPKENLEILLTAGAGPLHLAMALNAAYFPSPMWENSENGRNPGVKLADMMENMLSHYWYGEDQMSFLQKSRSTGGVDQLKLFECESSLSVLEVAKNADDWNTPVRFGDILDGIAKLPVEKQNEKIKEYNHLLLELIRQPDRASAVDMILTGLDYVSLPGGVSMAKNILELAGNLISAQESVREYRKKQELGRKIKKIEGKKPDSRKVEDIYILDKVYRVARLRQHRIRT